MNYLYCAHCKWRYTPREVGQTCYMTKGDGTRCYCRLRDSDESLPRGIHMSGGRKRLDGTRKDQPSDDPAKRVNLLVTSSQYQQLKAYAQARKKPLSTFIREDLIQVYIDNID